MKHGRLTGENRDVGTLKAEGKIRIGTRTRLRVDESIEKSLPPVPIRRDPKVPHHQRTIGDNRVRRTTAVAHLAGAMGRRTFTLVPFLSDFRWFTNRDDSPWYPTMRLFRLRSIYGWGEAIERAAEALEELVKARMV